MNWGKSAIIVFFVLMLILVEKKYSPTRRFFVPIKRWVGYRLNWVTICTLILTICVLITIVMGIFLYRSEVASAAISDEQNISPSNIDIVQQEAVNERLGDGILFGIQLVFDLLEGNYEKMRNGFPNHPFLTWLLCFLIPFMTVSTVVMSLLKAFPRFFLPRKEFLIFSQVEENSVHLAESMMIKLIDNEEQDSKRKVRWDRRAIFLRAEKSNLSPEYSDRLKKIKARVYPYTEADFLRIHWGLKRKKLRFFFLSPNTELNFSRMRVLLEEVNDDSLFLQPVFMRKKKQNAEEQSGIFRQELYLLSETESAPLLIDHLRKDLCEKRHNDTDPFIRKNVFQHTDLRLLDRYRTVMYDLLQKKPLYECADDKKIRVLVLGFGRVGKAFFRAAVSFCPMADYESSFCITDININRQWHDLLLQYPKCDEGIAVKRSRMDVESEKLLTFLDQAANNGKPFTYIVLSLGDDERNIKVASRIARHYRQRYWEKESTLLPVICVNLEDEIKSNYVSAFFKRLQPEKPLNVFGSDEHTFSEKMLINRELWAAARVLHLNLKNDDFAYWNEYERRSSVACAAHACYHCKVLEGCFTEETHKLYFDSLREEQKEAMVDAEHRRWMAYSRCEGMQYVHAGIASKFIKSMGTHVDIDARLTPCLVSTSDLDELYKILYPYAKETNLKREQEGKIPHRTFYERDRFVVRNIYRIQKIMKGKPK